MVHCTHIWSEMSMRTYITIWEQSEPRLQWCLQRPSRYPHTCSYKEGNHFCAWVQPILSRLDERQLQIVRHQKTKVREALTHSQRMWDGNSATAAIVLWTCFPSYKALTLDWFCPLEYEAPRSNKRTGRRRPHWSGDSIVGYRRRKGTYSRTSKMSISSLTFE